MYRVWPILLRIWPTVTCALPTKNKDVNKSVKSTYSLFREALRGTDQDFTKGSINRGIVLLAVPMMLELTLEAVFAVVDIFFVAQLGSEAIAVVGLTEALITILYAVSIGLSMAVTALVARRIGEHNQQAAATIAAQSLWVGGLLAAIISISGFVFADDL